MMLPMVDEHAVTATVKGLEYPDLTISGMITEPMPAVSAVLEPEMPANSMLATMLTWASPARTPPTRARASIMMRSVKPLELQSNPRE